MLRILSWEDWVLYSIIYKDEGYRKDKGYASQHHVRIKRDDCILYNNCSNPRGRNGHSYRQGRDVIAVGYSKIELTDEEGLCGSDRVEWCGISSSRQDGHNHGPRQSCRASLLARCCTLSRNKLCIVVDINTTAMNTTMTRYTTMMNMTMTTW